MVLLGVAILSTWRAGRQVTCRSHGLAGWGVAVVFVAAWCRTLVCETVWVLTLPDTLGALVLRTDFSDEVAWGAVCTASRTPSAEGFGANLDFVSDRAFAGLTVEQVTALPRPAGYRSFLFLVDTVTITDSSMPLVVVDLLRHPGRWFRVVPALVWAVENNLSLGNMDFVEFANAADPDGVFRGFPPSP